MTLLKVLRSAILKTPLVVPALAAVLTAVSAGADEGRALTLYIENDSRYIGGPGSDTSYSNGLKLSYIEADNHVPGWARPFIDSSETLSSALDGSQSNFSLSLGHQIYTPSNTGTSLLVGNDRPYAAWLYVGLGAHFKDSERSHALELDVGIIGPEALGEQVQNGYHRMIGVRPSMGWEHQLATEPTLQLSYQQRRKFLQFNSETYGPYFDVIPFFGASLGNVAINTYGGGMVRLGTHLPDDFGPSRASSFDGDIFVEPLSETAPDISLYAFAGGRGIAVGRNIFLDGNTFRHSHHVSKRYFLIETEFGAAFTLRPCSLVWRFVTRSPEFRESDTVNSFASISFSYAFK